jgi:hypothetical protein
MRHLLLGLCFTFMGILASGCAHKPSQPAMVTRGDWGSAPQAIPAARQHVPDRITVHHAGVMWRADGNPYQNIKNLQSWGQRERNWPDLPYHYLIAPDGTIFEGRPVGYTPETNTSYDTRGHIGIQLWGNFEDQRTIEPQLRATVELIAWLCDTHQIDPATISGHKDVAEGTLCPGKDLYRYVEGGQLETWVREIMAGKKAEIELLPAVDGGPEDWIPVPTLQITLP